MQAYPIYRTFSPALRAWLAVALLLAGCGEEDDTEQPASFSLFQIGGFTEDDQTASFEVAIPGLLSFLATNSFKGTVVGMTELQSQYEQLYGPGNYIPDVRLAYWSMRVMAYLGTLLVLLSPLALAAWLAIGSAVYRSVT